MSLQGAAAGAALAALLAFAVAGGAYLKGRSDEGDKRDAEAAAATIGAVRANIESWEAANTETAALVETNQRLIGDLDNARRRIAHYNAPPPPGRVGGRALIDPHLARIFVCDQQRLRGEAALACRGDAADGADGAAALEPVPAGQTP